MPVSALQSKKNIIFLPHSSRRPTCSILVNNLEYKTELLSYKVKRYSTISIDSAEMVIENFRGQNTTKFSKGMIGIIYTDYSGGTTKIFEGKVAQIGHSTAPYKIKLNLNGYGSEALSRIVNKTYESQTISSIFTNLINTYLPTHTTTNVETNSSSVSVSWNGKKLLNCLQDLVKLTGMTWTFYCDFDKDWHFFDKTTKTSTLEALTYTRNLKKISPLDTLSDVKNKITVIGKSYGGIQLYYSKTTGYGTDAEDVVIRDSNLTALDMVKDKVNELVIANTESEGKGKGEALGMPDLNPSDKVYIFAPYQNIQGWYLIPNFIHSLSRHRFSTSFDFQEEKKEIEDLSSFLTQRKITEQEISDITNEFDLDSSFIMDFDDSTYIGGSSSKVEALDDYLQLESGESSGTFVSTAQTVDSNVTSFVLRVDGEALTGMTFYVSVDNGTSYQTVSPNTLYDATSEGKQIIIKVSFTSATQRIKFLGCEYN